MSMPQWEQARVRNTCLTPPAKLSTLPRTRPGSDLRWRLRTPPREVDCLLKRENAMNAVKICAIVLIVAGGLGLAYGSFSYTKETHKATLGSIELSVKDKET